MCAGNSIDNYRVQSQGPQIPQAALYFLSFDHLKISLGVSTWAAFGSKPSEKLMLC